MLVVSLILNVILLAVLGYILYPDIKARIQPVILPVRVESHYVVMEPTKPKCPICSEELVGKVKHSVSGHWCCERCFVTRFNNR